jgi:hypothetical protein
VIPDPPEDLNFRSLAAPGLDEDDLYAAMVGLPGELLWGAGRPTAFHPDPDTTPPDPERERRRRHREMLARWEIVDGADPPKG